MVDLGGRILVAAWGAPRTEALAAASVPHVDVVSSPDRARVVPGWAALADRSAVDNAFFHPGFALPAIGCLGAGVALATVAVDGRLAAVAPFTRARLGRVAPAARLWSHKFGPLGTPLAEATDAAAALIEGLAPAGSGMSLVVPDLPLDGPVAAVLLAEARRRGRPVDVLGRHARAIVDRPLGGLSVDLIAALPARRRKELGRQRRRLAELGRVTFGSETEGERVLPAFEAFMALEAAGWKGRRGTALASSPQTAAFARAAIASRARSGAVRIDSLAVAGRPAAMLVTLIAGATAFTWKIAHDETLARFSPGAQLMREVPGRIFAETSVVRIDSCADAGHPMIDRLWPGRMAVGTLVVGPPGGGMLYRAGLLLANAEAAARAAVRRRRRRSPPGSPARESGGG